MIKLDKAEAEVWNHWRQRLDCMNIPMPPKAMAVHWFAATDDIAKMGPYETQAQAVKALRKVALPPQVEGALAHGAIVWCEEI